MTTGCGHVRDYRRVLRLRLCLRPGDRDGRRVHVRRDGGPVLLDPRPRERARNDVGSRGLPNGRRVLFQRSQRSERRCSRSHVAYLRMRRGLSRELLVRSHGADAGEGQGREGEEGCGELHCG